MGEQTNKPQLDDQEGDQKTSPKIWCGRRSSWQASFASRPEDTTAEYITGQKIGKNKRSGQQAIKQDLT